MHVILTNERINDITPFLCRMANDLKTFFLIRRFECLFFSVLAYCHLPKFKRFVQIRSNKMLGYQFEKDYGRPTQFVNIRRHISRPKYSNWKLENFNFTRFSHHRATCFCQPRIKQCAFPLPQLMGQNKTKDLFCNDSKILCNRTLLALPM